MTVVQSDKFRKIKEEDPTKIDKLIRHWVRRGLGFSAEPVEVEGKRYILKPVISAEPIDLPR
ncbi:hypothetical protein [Neolewinella antarctica]|uniref:Uncharacterized protein n=1 Tax=Neolewinella antarctica TaxID=442734 RepID=A0ABX0XCZ4_9BACT|nr:hypothetical protein [Neolewinella antarctica]NJC27072.1 hypothetical protein [Neolewinella antarctica]